MYQGVKTLDRLLCIVLLCFVEWNYSLSTWLVKSATNFKNIYRLARLSQFSSTWPTISIKELQIWNHNAMKDITKEKSNSQKLAFSMYRGKKSIFSYSSYSSQEESRLQRLSLNLHKSVCPLFKLLGGTSIKSYCSISSSLTSLQWFKIYGVLNSSPKSNKPEHKNCSKSSSNRKEYSPSND